MSQTPDARPPAGRITARVHIALKQGVLDPQGKAIGHALQTLGFSQVGAVRQGKLIELDLEAGEPEQVRQAVAAMCDKLLANTVIENYRVEVLG